jgi:hypothetical protein
MDAFAINEPKKSVTVVVPSGCSTDELAENGAVVLRLETLWYSKNFGTITVIVTSAPIELVTSTRHGSTVNAFVKGSLLGSIVATLNVGSTIES